MVAGQGNIRGTEGPRNAVATGLLLAGQANERRSRQPLFNVLFQDADNEPDFYLNRAVRGQFLGTGLLIFFGAGCVAALQVAGASFGQWEISIIWGLGVAMAIYLTAGVSGAHLIRR